MFVCLVWCFFAQDQLTVVVIDLIAEKPVVPDLQLPQIQARLAMADLQWP